VLRPIGFEVGWGDTVGRVTESMRELLDILQACLSSGRCAGPHEICALVSRKLPVSDAVRQVCECQRCFLHVLLAVNVAVNPPSCRQCGPSHLRHGCRLHAGAR